VRPSVPESADELTQRNISTRCPYCGDTVRLVVRHTPVISSEMAYFVATCPNEPRRFCRPIFAVYQALNDVVIERYPIPSFDPDRMDESIPGPIRADFAEAKRCSYAKAWKGAVALLRRVVEAVACAKLGNRAKGDNGKTRRLHELIDLMHTEGLITRDIRDNAHEIRYFGNYGAHLQDDGLDMVSESEVDDVEEVTWQLLYTLYVAPAAAKRLRDKRSIPKA
jgi:Domain of unknown function (DUF4145)